MSVLFAQGPLLLLEQHAQPDTLGLRGTSVCPKGMDVSLEVPASLEHLCLSHILPTNGLTLPPGCQVFLAGNAQNLNDENKQ